MKRVVYIRIFSFSWRQKTIKCKRSGITGSNTKVKRSIHIHLQLVVGLLWCYYFITTVTNKQKVTIFPSNGVYSTEFSLFELNIAATRTYLIDDINRFCIIHLCLRLYFGHLALTLYNRLWNWTEFGDVINLCYLYSNLVIKFALSFFYDLYCYEFLINLK